jgi:outer membrane protein assembly complex protein YaeT
VAEGKRTLARRLALWTACWAGLISAQTVDSQFQPEAARIVTAVRFEPPESRQPLLPSDLAAFIRCKVGEPLQEECVTESIQALFSSGRYEDIEVDARPAPGGLELLFRTKPSYFIGRVAVRGVPEPPNVNLLANETNLQLGQLYSEAAVKQAIERMQAVLRANGFFRAAIQVNEDRDEITENIDLTFIVNPGERARIQSPRWAGDLQADPKQLLRKTLWLQLWPRSGFRPMTDARIQRGVDRIRGYYRKRDRFLSRVTLTSLQFDESNNSVTPVITVQTGPKVKVRTTGVKLSSGRLRALIPVFQEQAVDRELLVEGQQNLELFFESQGFFDVRVSFTETKTGADETVVEYAIYRGPKYRLAELDVQGAGYFGVPAVLDVMDMQKAAILGNRSGRFSQETLRRDVQTIKNLYRSNGFLDVDVQSRIESDYQGRERDLAVFLTVKEGPQATVRTARFEGASAEDEQYFRERVQLIENQPFSDAAATSDQELMLAYYFGQGYVNAEVDVDARPVAGGREFDLTYRVRPGKQQFVRRVLNSGLETTSVRLFYQRVPLKNGDPLSIAELSDAQRRLYDLGIFAKVDVALQNPEGSEALKYVLYRIEEARRYSFSVALGAEGGRFGGQVTRLDSPAGDASFSPRISLGVSRLNFLGIGHTVSAQARYSRIQTRGVLTYIAPQFIGREDLSLSFSALGELARDVRTFEARRFEGTLQVSQRYSKATTLQYRLTYRQVNLLNVKITPELVPLFSRPVRTGLLGAGLLRDRRDNPIDSTRGTFTSLDFGLSSRYLGSRNEFARLLFRNTSYHRLAKDVYLARTTQFGIQTPFGLGDGVDAIPLPERFFGGGAASHRGFPENQAGPRDPVTGFPIGGSALLLNGVELRFPLIGENLRGVLFHDAGNVYSEIKKVSFRWKQRDLTDFNFMSHAVGVGVRYNTPAGPVRVDLGYMLNPTRFRGCQGSFQELLQANGPCNPASPNANFRTQRVFPLVFHFSLGQTF